MKICSWNVNGIRSIGKKGFCEWMAKTQFDIVCVQEIKAFEEQFPAEILGLNGYSAYVHSALRPGYSGVTSFVKNNIEIIDYSHLNVNEFDSEGRVQVLELNNFILFNCYLPNGGRDHSRVDFKLACSQATLELANELRLLKKKPIVFCGDFNTAHHSIDLTNAKSNAKTTGFLPREREWIDSFLENGYQDIFREQHKEEPGHYTWWSYRNDCRKRNIGWRIDYFMTDRTLAKNVSIAEIHPDVLGSDHCPLSIELSF